MADSIQEKQTSPGQRTSSDATHPSHASARKGRRLRPAAALLAAAAAKRLQAGDSTVVAGKLLDAAEREPLVRLAASLRRPRHVILVETGREQTEDEDRPKLNELRRAIDAGEVGAEGFQTALRLGGGAVGELKRIVFRPPPQDD